jgi:hypothetical protein
MANERRSAPRRILAKPPITSSAKPRNISKWVKYLNQTLDLWGDQAEVLFASHMWPLWSNAEIVRHIESYRDAFKFIHDRLLHLANAGHTLPELGDVVQLPAELAKAEPRADIMARSVAMPGRSITSISAIFQGTRLN